MNINCFMCDYYVALISVFVLVEMWQFKNNCSGLKIDWGSPPTPRAAIYGMHITSLHFVVFHKFL